MSRRSIYRISLLVLVVLVGLGIGASIKASGFRPVRVTSGSMTPTIDVDEWIIVADADDAARGDVIEFRYPTGSTGRAIKRVFAVGGDVVELTDRTISVNGEITRLAGEPVGFERGAITVPDGYLYLLGDNHAGSYDSRGFGPVPATDVVGRVRTTIPNPRILAVLAAGLAAIVVFLPATIRRLRRLRRLRPPGPTAGVSPVAHTERDRAATAKV